MAVLDGGRVEQGRDGESEAGGPDGGQCGGEGGGGEVRADRPRDSQVPAQHCSIAATTQLPASSE